MRACVYQKKVVPLHAILEKPALYPAKNSI